VRDVDIHSTPISLADEMREDSNSNLPHSISASESIPEGTYRLRTAM